MSEVLNKLLERRASLWSAATTHLDEVEARGEESAEEAQKWSAMSADLDKLDERIEDVRKKSAREADHKRSIADLGGDVPSVPTEDRQSGDELLASAFRSYLTSSYEDMPAEHRQALAERRALATGTDSAGGYLVPESWANSIIEVMAQFSGARQVATVIPTSSGEALNYPKVDETSTKGERIGENVAASEGDPAFTNVTLEAHIYSSKMVRIPFTLLQDNAFNLEGWLPGALGSRIGRIQNEEFTTGAGTSGIPEGFVTGATTAVTAASATAVTTDELIDLTESVDEAYLAGNPVFTFRQSVRGSIRKLKDSNGQYIWRPGLRDGEEDQLLGYRYVVNNDMPAMTTGLKPIVFGDIAAGFIVRDVAGIPVRRLVERYAEFGQVAFLGFHRADSAVVDANAFKALAML